MERSIEPLGDRTHDLLVIGGGITGAGIALDAALRGLSVALIEKGDFAAATSSASSKLIHGGLRYLEGAHFGLVREALRERHTLLRIAPHLVRPLPILLPIYHKSTRPRWMVKLGLSLYDWLAGRARIGRHAWWTPAQIAAQAPGIRTQGLRGGFRFFDAQMDDARLCLEVVLSAMAAGAQAANYVEAVELVHDAAGRMRGCEAVDRLSGSSFRVSARVVVSAAGPWADRVRAMDRPDQAALLTPTKGVHIVLAGRGLTAGLLLAHPQDGRVLFVLPWMGRTLVGTTDTFYGAAPDDVHAGASDVAYLLDAFNGYFDPPAASRDVVATLAGLRPLLASNARSPSAVSRECAMVRSASGLWTITGGKYTTYRHMAEQMVDAILSELGGSPRRMPSPTASHRLIGAPAADWTVYRSNEPAALARDFGLAPETATHLVDRYGSRARRLLEECAGDRSCYAAIVPGEPDVRGEFAFQAAHELARRPEDHLLRRTRLGLFHPELLDAPARMPCTEVRRSE